MFKDFLNAGLERIGLQSQAKMVEFGYGQVEPNHLSAQRTAQIYAQLPANPEIKILEQGQFVKYDYAANDNGIGEVNFGSEDHDTGEWMLVYNEIKLYKNHLDGTKQWDCEFAMLKDDYQARIYTPYDWEAPEVEYHDWHRLNGKDEKGATSMVVEQYVSLDIDGKGVTINGERIPVDVAEDGTMSFKYGEAKTVYTLKNGQTEQKVPVTYEFDDVTADVPDIYEMNWTNDPWKRLGIYREKKMRPGTAMVPRVFKTNVGDIMTTNTIDEKFDSLNIGDIVAPRATDGILCKAGDTASMKWQVVKKYTMPDGQNGVKIMRIA